VAAAIPSGVGFLGAAVIWKQTNKEQDGHSVHGLPTAASVWLSAAVGIACSGELYFAATFSVAIILVLLRFGPRMFSGEDFESNDCDGSDADDDADDDEEASYKYHAVLATASELQHLNLPNSPLSPSIKSTSIRSIASRRLKKQKKPSLME
jgi:uncharacterized membrane protein YhiD involved in acid resistance